MGFKKQLADAKYYEEIITELLISEKYCEYAVGVGEEKQHKDIIMYDKDFIQIGTAEVKSDYRLGETGNVLFELYHDRKTGRFDGWFNGTNVDYLCYINCTHANDNELFIYIIDWKECKRFVEEYPDITKFWNRYDSCTTYVKLVNIGKLKRFMKSIYHTDNAGKIIERIL